MINFFDKIYSIKDKYRVLKKLRFYSALRFIVRIIANVLVPLHYNFTNLFVCNTLKANRKKQQIIVSLTSFPQRIGRIWIVIESIIRQKNKPDRIILRLSLNQFKTLELLPKKLLNLQKRGLEIRLCNDDLRSHKKYYYAFQEFPHDVIITLDDDVIYNSNLIKHLLRTHKKFPFAIICNHASKINIKNKQILPYARWTNIKKEIGPTNEIMPIGVGGVLYPPDSMYKDVTDVNTFKEYCINADDIWLNFMCRLKGTLVVKTKYKSNYLPVINLNNSALNTSNIHGGLNDKHFNQLRNYYIKIKNVDPFYDLIN